MGSFFNGYMMIVLSSLLGVLLLVGCFIPANRLPRKMPHEGLLHAGAFALVSLPLCLITSGIEDLIMASLGVWLLGVVIECLQNFVPGRQFGWDDVFYNTLGICMVAIPCGLAYLMN